MKFRGVNIKRQKKNNGKGFGAGVTWCKVGKAINWTLHTIHGKLHTTCCTLHTAYYKLNTAHFMIHTKCCTLNTAHHTLNTAHYTLPVIFSPGEKYN